MKLVAGKISNIGIFELTCVYSNLHGHFVVKYRILVHKMWRLLLLLILRVVRVACRKIEFTGIQDRLISNSNRLATYGNFYCYSILRDRWKSNIDKEVSLALNSVGISMVETAYQSAPRFDIRWRYVI